MWIYTYEYISFGPVLPCGTIWPWVLVLPLRVFPWCKKFFWSAPGFEPGTSRTRSENHTPRPRGQRKTRSRPRFELGTSRTLSENHTPRPTGPCRMSEKSILYILCESDCPGCFPIPFRDPEVRPMQRTNRVRLLNPSSNECITLH